MDNYRVQLLSRALRDLDGIYAYIAKTLQEPETALHMVEELEAQILSLETMPYRCAEREPAHTRGKATASCSLRTTPLSSASTRRKNRLSS